VVDWVKTYDDLRAEDGPVNRVERILVAETRSHMPQVMRTRKSPAAGTNLAAMCGERFSKAMSN